MTGQDETRWLGGAPDVQKTRLIRREGEDRSTSRMQPEPQDETRTRLAFRPRPPQHEDSAAPQEGRYVTGWLVVTAGPGRGGFATVYDGMNSVGRGADQATRLDFGDDSISRSEHAFVTYDYKARKFYIQHGGKANVVRLNDQPVLQPMELKSGDIVSMGATELKFVGFCGEAFDWQG